MLTRTYNFQEVRAQRTVRIECDECKRLRTRTLKTYQTLNPFNKNPDGSVKSVDDIRRELPGDLDQMEERLRKKVFVCQSCERIER